MAPLKSRHSEVARELIIAKKENEQLAFSRTDLEQRLFELQESHTRLTEEITKKEDEIDYLKSGLMKPQVQATAENQCSTEKLSHVTSAMKGRKRSKGTVTSPSCSSKLSRNKQQSRSTTNRKTQ